ncbi:TonB-dependent receptor [Phenylobacterium sp.]|uniref:TonB-dependent receptor n=1 Tax=Phenylobacterium sp. TaxID=1871053 RepID=UPI00301C82EE
MPEVVVTAQKRAESLQDVPISMEVVSGAKIADFGVTDFKQMIRFTPNVSVLTTAGNDVIYIRGFGSPPTNYAFDQSVSMYLDGVYAGKSRQAQAPLFDLERVEVLRGPQGALFGKNTPAGAVSLVSAGPTSTFQGAVNGLYNFDLDGGEVNGFVAGPIGDHLGARLAVRLVDHKGYIRNDFNGNKEPSNEMASARLTLRYAPRDDFDYTVKVEYSDRDVKGGANVSSPLTTPQQPNMFRFGGDSALGLERSKATSWLVSGTGNLQLGDFTLTALTGYSFFRANVVTGFDQALPGGGVTPNSVYTSYPEHFEQTSQEIRLSSPDQQRLKYTIGAYYDRSIYHLTQFTGFDIRSIPYFGLHQNRFKQVAETFSLFGQAEVSITEALRAVGSLRYTQSDKRGTFGGRLVFGPFAYRPITTAVGRIDEDYLDPSINLQYDIAPRIMVYAAYGRGSKSGGLVSNTYGTTNATFTFKPERSTNYEVGVKSTLDDGRLILNAAIYNTKFKDLQVSTYDPALPGFRTGNAASAHSRGIEGALAWHPMQNLDFTLSAAYQDVEYDDYPGASCLASQPVTQCNPASPASIAANNIGGATISHVSKFSGNFTAHYRHELGDGNVIDSMLTVHGRSKYFNADNQHPLYGVQRGYAKVDARVQYGPDDEKWYVALVGKNLTNEKTVGSATTLPVPLTAVPRAFLYLDETRTISIGAGMKF